MNQLRFRLRYSHNLQKMARNDRETAINHLLILGIIRISKGQSYSVFFWHYQESKRKRTVLFNMIGILIAYHTRNFNPEWNLILAQLLLLAVTCILQLNCGSSKEFERETINTLFFQRRTFYIRKCNLRAQFSRTCIALAHCSIFKDTYCSKLLYL